MAIPNVISEAVVTPEEYEAVQRRLAANKAQGGRVVQSYLLRGRLPCEVCSRRLRGKLARGKGMAYCRYLCPYGALLSLFSRCAWRTFSITPDRELDCGLCRDACPYGAIEQHRATGAACFACGRCYRSCPVHRGAPTPETGTLLDVSPVTPVGSARPS